jgi:hypothetical protein
VTDAARPSGAPGPARELGRGVVGAVVVFAVVLGAVWWSTSTDGTDSESSKPPPSAGPPLGEIERDELATDLLQSLNKSWMRRDVTGFVDAAGDSDAARRWAGQVFDTLDALGVQWIDLRYVAADSESVADPFGFTADVEVRWEIAAGPEHQTYRTAPVLVPLRFSYEDDELALVGLDSPADDPVPVWLTGAVSIATARGGTCVGVPDSVDLDTCTRLIDVAIEDLTRVVSTDEVAARPVVIMVPDSENTAALLLGQDTDELAQIAAVTTTLDGSNSDQAPAQVVFNPDVFDDLGRKAAQLVVSHEVTHAATGVTVASIELWVAEGFADYVALASGRIPVERAASQILSYVRKHEVPAHLPGALQFASDRHGLGRTYESAWLIFRMLGDYYGDDAVVDFYDEVRTGTPVEPALVDTVGLDLEGLTTAWQDYLTNLAFGNS